MKWRSDNQGFTLLELLVAIAIIGILASIVIASLSSSREQARNKKVLVQMDQYSKALELYYTNHRRYPNGNSSPTTFPQRVYCIGDNFTGTPSPCLPSSAFGVPQLQNGNNSSHAETSLKPQFMSTLPNFIVTKNGQTFSSPGYSACNATGASCRVNFQEYTLWYVLEGSNQDCGRGTSKEPGFWASSDITLCHLGPAD